MFHQQVVRLSDQRGSESQASTPRVDLHEAPSNARAAERTWSVRSNWSFTAIALFAVANTGLLNFVMASRLLYGMARQELVPAWLGHVHEGTNTPYWSIATVFIAALVLALSGTLVYLAGITSVLLLAVFFSVNVALLITVGVD